MPPRGCLALIGGFIANLSSDAGTFGEITRTIAKASVNGTFIVVFALRGFGALNASVAFLEAVLTLKTGIGGRLTAKRWITNLGTAEQALITICIYSALRGRRRSGGRRNPRGTYLWVVKLDHLW